MACGMYTVKGPNILKRDFTPAFSVNNMLKDLRFITRVAEEKGQPLPVTTSARALFEKAQAQGLGDKDLTAILLALLADAHATPPQS